MKHTIFLLFTLLTACSSQPTMRHPAGQEGLLPLKVLTINVWDVGFANGELTDYRLRMICDRFREEAAKPPSEGWDVILVQELWPWSRHAAFRDCGYPYVATINTRKKSFGSWSGWLLGKLKGDAIDTGLYVLSRYPMLAPERHTFTQNGYIRYTLSDGDYLANKSVMFVPVMHPQIGPVQVFNTHLVSRNGKENYNRQRRKQLEEMARFIRLHRDPRFPALFGGDLNFGPPPSHQPANRAFLDKRAWSALPRTFAGFQRIGGEDFLCTYCGSRNYFARYASPEEVDQSIDHLFASQEFQATDTQVALTGTERVFVQDDDIKPELVPLKSASQSGAPAGSTALDLPYSDHFGLETTLWAAPSADPDRAAAYSQNTARYCYGDTPAPPWCWWDEFRKKN